MRAGPIEATRAVIGRKDYNHKPIQPLSMNAGIRCWVLGCGGAIDRYREGMYYCDRCGQEYRQIGNRANPRAADLRPV